MQIRAYPRRDEDGGGFRGVCVLIETKERIESPVFETFDQAKFWAQNEAHKRMNGRHYNRAYIRKPRNYYTANIWAEPGLFGSVRSIAA